MFTLAPTRIEPSVGVSCPTIIRASVVLPSPLRPTRAILSPRSMVKFAPLKTCLEPNDIPASLISATICPERGAGGNLMLSVARSSSSTSIRSRRSSCLMRDCTWFDLVGL